MQIYSKKAIKIFQAKSSGRTLLKQNAPRKEHWRFLLVEIVALLLLLKKPFWIGPLQNSKKPYGRGRFYYGEKPNNRDRHNAQYGGKQNGKYSGVSGEQSDSRRVPNKSSSVKKKFAYRKNPKPAIGRKVSSFQQNLGKIDPRQDQEILSVVKQYVTAFLKAPVQRTIPKQVIVSKTQELPLDQEITDLLDKGSIKMWNIISQANN